MSSLNTSPDKYVSPLTRIRGANAKDVVKYAALPGILPRAQELFASGFGQLAFLMASLYAMVRLLPAGHPYLNPQNVGQFGMRHVIAAAAGHLVMKRENIDQILIFFAILMALILLFVQMIAVVYGLLVEPASAQNVPDSLFATPVPSGGEVTDIALLMLERVFGVPDMFCPIAADGTNQCSNVLTAGPTPFHLALQALFQFYSLALLLVGVLIFLYFLVVVVAETAMTGTPFGQRFQNIWAPIRLVVAIGLLIPINFGYNTAQYLTFYAAKFGSGFATNAWISFNRAITADENFDSRGGTSNQAAQDFGGADAAASNPLGERTSLIARPGDVDISPIPYAVSLAFSCAYGHSKLQNPQHSSGVVVSEFPVKPYLVSNDPESGQRAGPAQIAGLQAEIENINGMLSAGATDPALMEMLDASVNALTEAQSNPSTATTSMEVGASTTYEAARAFYSGNDVIIRFGVLDSQTDRFKQYAGRVEPTCGEIRIKNHSSPIETLNDASGGEFDTSAPTSSSVDVEASISEAYYDFIIEMWHGDFQEELLDFSQRFMEIAINTADDPDPCDFAQGNQHFHQNEPDCREKTPKSTWKQNVIQELQVLHDTTIKDSFIMLKDNAPFELTTEVLDRGWGGAGIWYNQIARLNGSFITTVLDIPELNAYPLVMEETRRQRRSNNNATEGVEAFSPRLSSNDPRSPNVISLNDPRDLQLAIAMNQVHQYWIKDSLNFTDGDKQLSGNFILDIVNIMLGTSALFDIRGEGALVHPLAQLAAIGGGLVESSVRNLAGATASSFLGGIAGAAGFHSGAAVLNAFSSFATSTAFLGLTIGFILFYILPFLPFIYVFFAVGNWVKSIFEAMVGLPLWALAHLRLDGDGLPGEAASNGYFLIFEIFIRPILIVFGLVAAILILTAQVRVLNLIFEYVTTNVTGFNDDLTDDTVLGFNRGPIDELFFTILYAIMVYLMATTSFKLIDQIPREILRWSGASVSAFSDINNQDAVDGLQRYAAVSGVTVGRQLTTGATTAAGGVGGALGGSLQRAGVFGSNRGTGG